MRALLCHNPTSGTKGHDKDTILAALKLANIDVRYVSVKSDEFPDALKSAANKGMDLVVAAGGDGTMSKVLTRLPDRSVPVALLPLGTANNAARSLGIAGTPQELVETWKIEYVGPLDIGSAKGPWGTTRFLEAFGVGLFADFLLQATKGRKAEGAHSLRQGRAQLQKTLKEAKPIDIDVVVDGKPIAGEFLGVEIMNIPFTGPALPLGADADVDDGQLDAIFLEAKQRDALIDWLEAPLDKPPPVRSRKGRKIELTWSNASNRIDDQAFDNKGKRMVAELACEKEQPHILIPLKHPAQQAPAPKKKNA